jgi:UDP-N-acetylmuramoyl-tripeptide--D-alanyl-D-alanine ligase
LIGTSDSIKALGALGGYHRDHHPASIVAVTGSNGKTTVKRMIHHILSKRMGGSCGPKSFNNEIGVPLTLLGAEEKDDYVVCEIGSSAPGEITGLSAIARPNVAVITNVAETHLEKLGTLERVAAEKASILGYLEDDGLAVVWADDEVLAKLATSYHKRIVSFGQSDASDLRLTGYESKNRTQRFELNGRLWVDLSLPGKHNALNALAAIAVAQRFGFSQSDAGEALRDFQGVEMRLQWLDLGPLTVINDAYNANPASMLAAAKVLAAAEGSRRVLVAGDMGELGAGSKDLHVRTGSRIAETGIDLLIAVGPLGRYIAQGAAEAALPIEQFDTLAMASQGLCDLLRPGDVVLIKASRMVRMERLVEVVRAGIP